jgi:hypothetical protein
MSYDLFMKPRSGSVSRERFTEHFAARPHYKIEGDQAWYRNDDTEAYFVFEYSDTTVSNAPDDEGEPRCPLSFNLNYFRPSFFGLEAEPEVRAFVETLDLLVEDPQANGMGTGGFDSAKFLSGWNTGNAFGCQAILKQHAPEIHTLPTAEIERIWRWNHARARRQAQIGEQCYVARIFFVEAGSGAQTATLWPDAITSVLPKADYVIVGRNELAPKGFFGKKPDTLLVDWKELEPVIAANAAQETTDAFRLTYASPPDGVAQFVRNLPKRSRKFTGISADAVINSELFEKAPSNA